MAGAPESPWHVHSSGLTLFHSTSFELTSSALMRMARLIGESGAPDPNIVVFMPSHGCWFKNVTKCSTPRLKDWIAAPPAAHCPPALQMLPTATSYSGETSFLFDAFWSGCG